MAKNKGIKRQKLDVDLAAAMKRELLDKIDEAELRLVEQLEAERAAEADQTLEAPFPQLPQLPFDEMRKQADAALQDWVKPEVSPTSWEIDLAGFGAVPVSTVLRSLELLGLQLESVKVARA